MLEFKCEREVIKLYDGPHAVHAKSNHLATTLKIVHSIGSEELTIDGCDLIVKSTVGTNIEVRMTHIGPDMAKALTRFIQQVVVDTELTKAKA